jgi:hypothetical protein
LLKKAGKEGARDWFLVIEKYAGIGGCPFVGGRFFHTKNEKERYLV